MWSMLMFLIILKIRLSQMYFEAFVWGTSPYTYDSRPYYKVESTTKLDAP